MVKEKVLIRGVGSWKHKDVFKVNRRTQERRKIEPQIEDGVKGTSEQIPRVEP